MATLSAQLPQLALVAVLIVLNALFAGMEMALVTLREGQLQRLEQRSAGGRLVAGLARDPNRFLATIQIGITLAGFLASAAAAVSLSEPLERSLGALGTAARPVSIVIVTLILAYLTLVFGELAPKRVAMQRAEMWALVGARPLSVLSTLTRPIVWLLSHSTDVVVRLSGGDPDLGREVVTDEELRDMVAIQRTLTDEHREIIDGAFQIAERTLGEVLVPRGDVFFLDQGQPCDEALRALAGSGHSRAPVVVNGNLDDVLGIVHLRDLLDGGTAPVSEVASRAQAFPETARVLDTLRELQTRRTQLALVTNEHGGVEGIATLEDLIEELVGEIYDETDRDIQTAAHNDDGSITLPGRFPIHDLPDIGVILPEGEYNTIAGLVLDQLGHIPEGTGESVEVDGWRLEVRGVERRSITEVLLTPIRDDGTGIEHVDDVLSEAG